MPKSANNPKQFEKKLEALDELVETMESGDLSLEESLKLFEKGVTLTKECQKMLKDAKQKIETIAKETSIDHDDD